jgi:predicted metalloprotease
VLFGLRLLRKLMASPINPEVGVAAVCAHEYGHILQFKLGILDKLRRNHPTVKRVELHADFMSGYFAGLRRKERPQFPAQVVTTTIGALGDTLRSASDHHGTPAERRSAVVAGYKAAFEDHCTCAEAVQVGMNYVVLV